jgi:hypothetical protein
MSMIRAETIAPLHVEVAQKVMRTSGDGKDDLQAKTLPCLS